MGASRLVKYVVRFRFQGDFVPMRVEYHPKYSGRAGEKGLKKFVADFEKSTLPSGINSHLGTQRISEAYLIDQSKFGMGANVIAEYRAPLFEIVN